MVDYPLLLVNGDAPTQAVAVAREGAAASVQSHDMPWLVSPVMTMTLVMLLLLRCWQGRPNVSQPGSLQSQGR
jgi:hypothetical protein